MPENKLEELKRHPRVFDVYKSRVHLKKTSGKWFGLCPFHSEKSGSFGLLEQDGVLLYKCLGCGKAGNIFQFIERYDHISMKAAIAKVRDEVGGDTSWEETKKNADETFKGIADEEEVKEDRAFPLAVYEERLGSKLKGSPGA
jgi:DNA primase